MATKAEVNSNDLVIIPPVNNINDYTFVKNLGNGAQGVVNLYRQKSNNELCAIKEAKMTGIGKKFQEGIMKEADLLTIPPPHPNIVQCFGSWLDYNTNTFYTKEEYLEGMDLFDYYQANFTNIPEDELLSIIKGSLSGIAHLHQHNVWHRDLKLENIFRTNSGTIKLFDLGLGKCTSSEFTKSIVGHLAHVCDPSGDWSEDWLEGWSICGTVRCVEATSALSTASTGALYRRVGCPGCLMSRRNGSGPKGSSQKPPRRVVTGQRC